MDKEQIFSVLRKSICEVMGDLNETRITHQESLRNLRTNSVDRADILMQTMESLQVKIPMMNFATAGNIEEIIEVFEKGCAENRKDKNT